MYNDFAYVYDQLINSDINYSSLCDYIENIFVMYNKTPALVCDLACGTGNVTVPMACRGYDMIGVDMSENMLDVAKNKSADKEILYLCQNMKDLDLYGTCDAFLCMTDGFNYITGINSLKKIFKRIRECFIEPDGIFIFDISSEYKLSNVLGNNTYIYNTDDLFYSWENTYKKPFCKMELNFFKKNHTEYQRFEEVHIQRAYKSEEIISALKKSGFSSVDVYGEYTFEAPEFDDNRLIFVALP